MISKQTRKMLKSRKEFKEEVLERDNSICLWCGKPGTYETLDADHIAGRTSQIDDVRAAGATICSFYGYCDFHRLKHDGKAKWKTSQLPEECIKFIEIRKWKMWDGVIWDRK